MKKQEKELTVQIIEKELNPIVARATHLIIKNEEDMEIAAEELSRLNLAKDKVTARMETITKPAKETIKAAEAIWKPFIVIAKSAIEIIREKQSQYQTEKVNAGRTQIEKIADRTGDGKGKFKPETAVRKIEEVDMPSDRIITDSGSIGFREDKQFEIVTISDIPFEYLKADEVKIRAAMKAGIELPGVRYFTKQIPVNRR